MNQGNKPDLLIFHGPSCLDGFGCVWVVRGKWPDVPVFEGIYGQPPPDVTGMHVLIADFSYPAEVLREMATVAKSIILLDHHRTSKQIFSDLFEEGLLRGEHDETRSGAALTWEYVWGNRHAPKMIEHIQDRDLWKFQMEGTAEVTAVLSSYGQANSSMEAALAKWTEIARQIENGQGAIVISEGRAIIRQRQVDMSSVIQASARGMIIGGVKVPVVNAPYFWASDIGNALSNGQPFAATYMDLADGSRQFSLRSQEDGADVSAIAKEYGGGGHVHAAGFTAPAGWEGDIDQDETLEVIELKSASQVKVKEG